MIIKITAKNLFMRSSRAPLWLIQVYYLKYIIYIIYCNYLQLSTFVRGIGSIVCRCIIYRNFVSKLFVRLFPCSVFRFCFLCCFGFLVAANGNGIADPASNKEHHDRHDDGYEERACALMSCRMILALHLMYLSRFISMNAGFQR